MRVPFAVGRRLRQRVVDEAHPCLISIDTAGRLLTIHGDAARYGLADLGPGDEVSDRLPLLVGLDLSSTMAPEHWPMLELPGGRHADVLLEPHGGTLHLLLLDATAEHGRRLTTQQQANERALLNRRLASALAELEAARAALEAQNRELESLNAAKARFIAGLSHELRTPLTAVLGHAELLRGRLGSEAESADDAATGVAGTDPAWSLDAIQSGAQHLLSLVNNVLDHASLETGQLALNPTPMDPAQLLAELGRLLAPQAARRNLEFRLRPPESLPPRVETDATRLRQVLINLVNNALKYTEQGFVELSLDWQDGRLSAAVADTGPGIPEDQRRQILHPFHRGTAAAAGEGDGSVGLGLAITNELVRLLGGELCIGDRPGGGALFGFDIPAPAVAPPPVADASPALAVPLLLVDDAREIQLLYGKLLARAGYTVRTALTPGAALAAFDELHPRIVIVDVHLGEEDGAVLIRGLRARGYDGVLIAWSASSMLDDRERLLEAGADRYLVKPVPPLELQETLRGLLAERGG